MFWVIDASGAWITAREYEMQILLASHEKK